MVKGQALGPTILNWLGVPGTARYSKWQMT
jgi:hypothetical protein